MAQSDYYPQREHAYLVSGVHPLQACRCLAAIARLLHRLGREHPDEIQTWGGSQALLNPQLFPEILAAFEEDMRTLSLDEEDR